MRKTNRRISLKVWLCVLIVLGVAGCSSSQKRPGIPSSSKLFSRAITPVAYDLQRFVIDDQGQAYGTQGNSLYKIDSIDDELDELYKFDASIVGFHITAENQFIVSTDNDHWSESAPCNVYESNNSGQDFVRIKQISGGCAVWLSINSDQDNIYIGEYGPKKPNVSKNVWKQDAGTGHWEIIFQAPLNSEAHIHRVAIDPYSKFLWVTVGDTRKNRGVYVSTDQGESFKHTLDSQFTGVAFLPDKIYWGEDRNNNGKITLTDSAGKQPKTVFDANEHGNYSGSIYELLALPDGSVLAPIMKYADHNNVASLWHGSEENWQLLMIFESLPGQGKDTSSIAGPDKNGFVLLTGYKIHWDQL